MKLRVKKLPILLPLAVLAAALVTTAVMARLGQDSAADHTDLGRKYLNDMNYTGAISEFLQSISMDPTAEDARLGLAEAYVASGSPEMAAEILQPLTEAESPEAYRLLVASQSMGDPYQALLTAQTLVEHTDSAEDYAVRDELLRQVVTEPHSYAEGLDQRLAISAGEVVSAGSNTFGQLGTANGIATEAVQGSLQPAQFPGEAARVYCAGRTSYVVDTSGNLWAAGENRWGQLGLSYAAADPQSGWTQIVASGDVASAAGTAGMLYVLKTDGSLWYAGQGGVMELSRIRDFGEIMAVESGESRSALLTVSGELYVSDAGDPISWTRQASGVKLFCFAGDGLIWVTEDNQVCSAQYSMPQTPDGWTNGSHGVVPDFAVCDIAADSSGLLLRDADGNLQRIHGGQVYESDGSAVLNIYSAGGSAVVESADGTAAVRDLSAPAA